MFDFKSKLHRSLKVSNMSIKGMKKSFRGRKVSKGDGRREGGREGGMEKGKEEGR